MIICEIGRNHQGDESYAQEYLDKLLEARPDGITFQIREKEDYVGEKSELLMPDEFYRKSANRIKGSGIKFGMAIADPEKINFLEEIGADFYKVIRRDIINKNLTVPLLQTGKPVFVSTGMSDINEIEEFVNSTKAHHSHLKLIHTQLTHELGEVNLKAIPTMRERFGLPVAFGSHSPNPHVTILALAFEPSDIFFYVKRGRPGKYRDDEHAIPLNRVAGYIKMLRELHQTLGSGIKVNMENAIEKRRN